MSKNLDSIILTIRKKGLPYFSYVATNRLIYHKSGPKLSGNPRHIGFIFDWNVIFQMLAVLVCLGLDPNYLTRTDHHWDQYHQGYKTKIPSGNVMMDYRAWFRRILLSNVDIFEEPPTFLVLSTQFLNTTKGRRNEIFQDQPTILQYIGVTNRGCVTQYTEPKTGCPWTGLLWTPCHLQGKTY